MKENSTIKVLVVDDEENVLKSVKKVIKSKHPGYIVELINTPVAGLKKLENEKFDLVITDLMMPNMDGLEFIKKIFTIDRNIKVIMITGYATMKTALLALREGAHKYVSKPFTREELLNAIKEVFSENQPS